MWLQWWYWKAQNQIRFQILFEEKEKKNNSCHFVNIYSKKINIKKKKKPHNQDAVSYLIIKKKKDLYSPMCKKELDSTAFSRGFLDSTYFFLQKGSFCHIHHFQTFSAREANDTLTQKFSSAPPASIFQLWTKVMPLGIFVSTSENSRLMPLRIFISTSLSLWIWFKLLAE